MDYRELGQTGLKVSALSFGASSLGSMFHSNDEAAGIRTVHAALDLGINFIDVSPFYGLTKAETVLGRALRGVPRDRYLLATKAGRYGNTEFDFSAGRVTQSVDESLARLGVEYLDLIQVHDIEYGSLDQVVQETLPALRRVQETGKVRLVGITGFPLAIFRYMLERAEVDTILSYSHFTLQDTTLMDLVPMLQRRRIGVINASPLGQGLLTQQGTPSWHPAPAETKAVCARAAAFCRSEGFDIAQLAIQFSVAQPEIATTLVSTGNPDNITKNVRWLDAPIDQDLLAQVQKILAPVFNRTWPSGRPENN